jgi:hypothetical protein
VDEEKMKCVFALYDSTGVVSARVDGDNLEVVVVGELWENRGRREALSAAIRDMYPKWAMVSVKPRRSR